MKPSVCLTCGSHILLNLKAKADYEEIDDDLPFRVYCDLCINSLKIITGSKKGIKDFPKISRSRKKKIKKKIKKKVM